MDEVYELAARNLNAMHATLAAAIMELLLYLGKPYINSHPKVIQNRVGGDQ